MILTCLFIYTYGIINNEDKTYRNNINWYIMLYLLLLISITFLIGRTSLKFYNWWYSGQYVPFKTILSQLNNGSTLSILKNIIGNSIMLVPMSFLLMIKDKKYKNIFKQLFIILPIIIFIEIFQAFTHVGSFDIDDILLNYFGTIIFTFIITRFSIIDKIKKAFYTDYKIKYSVKCIIFSFALFLMLVYIFSLFFN